MRHWFHLWIQVLRRVRCFQAYLKTSHPEDCAIVAELRALALGPGIQVAQIDDNLPFRVQFHVRTVHRPRRRTFEVDSFGVVAAAMARALELVLAGFPVRRTSQVSADSRNHEDAFGVPYDPDAKLVLEFSVDAEAEIGGISDLEFGLRFVESAWEEEPQKHQQIDAERAQNSRHHEAAALGYRLAFIRFFGFGEYRFYCLRQGRLFRTRLRRPGGF